MPNFKHGKVTDILINQYNLTSYFKMARTKGDVDLLDATTFRATAKQFAGGFFGGDVSLEGLFEAADPLVVGANEVLDAALGAAVKPVGTIGYSGLDTLGNVCKLFQGDEQQHDVNSGVQNLVMTTAQFLASEGVRQGVVLAPIASYSTTANGSSVDNATATTNGAVAHLHVLSKTGTSPTIDWKIQHSTNNSIWVDLFTFTQATDKTSERLTVTGTINRYLRAIRTIGGSASPAFD